MNLALLMLLGLLWAVVLLPSAIRSRRRSLHHSMGGFARTMVVLSGGAGRAGPDVRRVFVPADAARIVTPPSGQIRARERRRRALVALSSTSACSLFVAALAGGAFWLPAGLLVAATVAYVAALRRIAVAARRSAALVRLDARRDDYVGDRAPRQRAVVG